VLNWITGEGKKKVDRLCLDSYMIKYLKSHYGLVSFDVEKGLVSPYEVKGSDLFGPYVEVLFEEKAEQDRLKKQGSSLYNPSYRETIKLYLNAVTGKLVMDKSRYSSLTFCSDESGEDCKDINGVRFAKDSDPKLNEWVNAGVMIYSYSKRLLFEYIRQLPNDSKDVIHVETDSIYFPQRCKEMQYTRVQHTACRIAWARSRTARACQAALRLSCQV
jgi:hypothetical protein